MCALKSGNRAKAYCAAPRPGCGSLSSSDIAAQQTDAGRDWMRFVYLNGVADLDGLIRPASSRRTIATRFWYAWQRLNADIDAMLRRDTDMGFCDIWLLELEDRAARYFLEPPAIEGS